MNKLTIRHKLTLAFLSIASLVAAIAVVDHFRATHVDQHIEEIACFHTPSVIRLSAMRACILEGIEEAFAYLLLDDPHERDEFYEKMDEFDSLFREFAQLAKCNEPGQEHEARSLEDIAASKQDIVDAATVLFEIYQRTGKVDPAALDVLEGHIDRWTPAIERLVESETAQVDEAHQHLHQHIGRGHIFMFLFILIVAASALCLGFLIARSISVPITKLRNAALRVSRGDLDTVVQVKSADEIGQLAGSFNKMTSDLKNSIDELQTEINHRKRAEQSLRASESKYRTLLENLPQRIFLKDSNSVYISCNEHYARDLGIAPDQISGKTDYDFYPAELAQKYIADDRETIQAGRTRETDEEYIQNAREVVVHTVKTPIKDSSGSANGILGIFWDVTERRKMEQALKASQAFLNTVIDTIPDPTHVLDLDYRIVLANRVDRDMAGARDLVADRVTCHEFSHHRDTPCDDLDHPCPLKLAVANKAPATVTHTHCDARNNEKIIEITAAPIFDEAHQLTHVLEICRDITYRKKAEEELQTLNHDLAVTAKKLEESNSQLKNFAYIASHDLREPLRKISAFGELLEESLGGKLEPDDRENLGFMINGAERMQQMIEGLLIYSRLERNEIVFDPVDLNELIDQLQQLELAVPLEDSAGLIQVPQPLPKVLGDSTQIRQLLQNLIANALKYRKEQTPPQVQILAEETGSGYLKVQIRDNGIGIPRQFQQDVFAMFKRLNPRGKYDGSGIGLAVCKKIVERHGGQIAVESEPDQGSTFWFTLPLAQSPDQKSVDDTVAATGG